MTTVDSLLLRFVCVACLSLLTVACTTTRSEPHPELGATWREYVEMPNQRALAISGDPEQAWVGAASGGHASLADAETSALAHCRERRIARRLPGPCRVYARGREIVWPAW